MITEFKMTLLEHLDELRKRLVRAILAFLIGTFICFGFAYPTMKQLVTAPIDALYPTTENPYAKYNYVVRRLAPYVAGGKEVPKIKLNYMTVMEPFVVKIKLSLLGGLVLSAPVILYQVWAFIGAGLLRRERSVVLRYLPFSLGLFATGVIFAYLAVVPVMFLYLLTVDLDLQPMLMYGSYVGLMVVMLACFGLAFQLPLILMALVRIGIVSVKTLSRSRRYAIVLIFISAAVLTPSPEPFSQCLLAIPMVGLYELGLWLARIAERKRMSAPEA